MPRAWSIPTRTCPAAIGTSTGRLPDPLAGRPSRCFNEGIKLRLATLADLPALQDLMPRSVRSFSRECYTTPQIESALRYVFGPETQLIADGTYYIAEADGASIAGCGGWSRRRTLFGGDQMKGSGDQVADETLLSTTEPARIRSFFVDPDSARRGVGTLLLDACVEAARAAGFQRLELAATLPGEAFYRRRGFVREERFEQTLPDGTNIAFVRMSYNLGTLPPV